MCLLHVLEEECIQDLSISLKITFHVRDETLSWIGNSIESVFDTYACPLARGK